MSITSTERADILQGVPIFLSPARVGLTYRAPAELSKMLCAPEPKACSHLLILDCVRLADLQASAMIETSSTQTRGGQEYWHP